jgi:hypothetical protein
MSVPAAFIQFGAGRLFFNPIGGNLAVNPTPRQAFTIQDVMIDFSGDIKELRGSTQYPEDTAVGDRKSTFKFGIGRNDLAFLNQVYFADVTTAGGETISAIEAHAIPGSGPYTITITPPGSGTFTQDLGVAYQSNIVAQLTNVGSGSLTAAGQYKIASAVYTFDAADAGTIVLISYAWSQTTQGNAYQVNNQAMGYGPIVEIYLQDTYQNVAVTGGYVYPTYILRSARIGKVGIPGKRADYSIIEMEGGFFANAAGRVLDMFSIN